MLDEALAWNPDRLSELPERTLLMDALHVLDTLGLDTLAEATPHPWLERDEDGLSVVERAAHLHRADGPRWWEPFVAALLVCFESASLEGQSWLPVGPADLTAPDKRVFLPAPVDTQADDEEVADVPSRVAAKLRLVDGSAMRLREDGRALTQLAAKMADARLVRRPRKTELLEDALFPSLEEAAQGDQELALDLFAQAIAWVASMKEASRKKLDCQRALVPVGTGDRLRWTKAASAYLGPGWGADDEHERLLAAAYPDTRLAAFSMVAARIKATTADAGRWRDAAAVLGVGHRPRIVSLARGRVPPLQSSHLVLKVKGSPSLGRADLDPFYQAYLRHLTSYDTTWAWTFDHDVDDVAWIDGMEDPARRQHVLDLVLMHPDAYLGHTTTNLRRVGHNPIHTVPQLWTHALPHFDWPIFPAEKGVGGEAVRVSASEAWLLSDGSRRTAFAKLVDVVPSRLAPAWKLLHAIGVWTVENAPLSRLLVALSSLADRLERDRLHTSRDALSLARELFTQVEDRLDAARLPRLDAGKPLPLLKEGRLVAADPSDDLVVILFDDDPTRARHIKAADGALRVPVARDAKFERLHAMFVAKCGSARVIRASIAKVELDFTPRGDAPEPFLGWLQRAFPRTQVAVELAALLTLGGERTLRSERISRNWRFFRDLQIELGSFAAPAIKSFYDRPTNLLRVSTSLEPEEVVAATWELAGARSRDMWEGYAHALRELRDRPDATRGFLRDREITEVEIVDVADAAGLHRSHNVDALECAMLAAYQHLFPGSDLDAAAAWWAGVERNPSAVAESLGRSDLAQVIAEAVAMQPPEGEMHLLRHVGVAWDAWQEAVLRRDGQMYRFEKSVACFRSVSAHLLAVARELAIRDSKVNLDDVAVVLDMVAKQDPPDAVACVPPDAAQPEREALDAVVRTLSSHPSMRAALRSLPAPPWGRELPIPEGATKRGVAVFKGELATKREVEASTTVQAIVYIAALVAPTVDEHLDPPAVLADSRLSMLIRGDWSNVYGALFVLRELLQRVTPETTKRLSAIRAFHGPTTAEVLKARLPELAPSTPPKPLPKRLGRGHGQRTVEGPGHRGEWLLGTKAC